MEGQPRHGDHLLLRAGVEIRICGLTPEQVEESVRLYGEGWSIRQLASRDGFNYMKPLALGWELVVQVVLAFLVSVQVAAASKPETRAAKRVEPERAFRGGWFRSDIHEP